MAKILLVEVELFLRRRSELWEMMLHVVDDCSVDVIWRRSGAGGTTQMRVGGENECMHYVCWMPAYVLLKKIS